MRVSIAAILLVFVGIAAGAVYHFTLKIDVEVNQTEVAVSPQSISVKIKKGATFVKVVTVKNYGEAREVFFKCVVEGPDPEAINVFVNDVYGSRIYSSNKLPLPAGSQENPSEVKVNVHVEVDENALEGEYTLYIMAKET